MNARDLLAIIDDCGMLEVVNRSGRDEGGWIQETILRALRLLAAVEGAEGETPETHDTLDAISNEDKVIYNYDPMVKLSRRLERERNAALRKAEKVKAHAEALANAYPTYWDAVNAYRSDYPRAEG